MSTKKPRPQPHAPLDPNQRYSISETAVYLRQSEARVYQDMRDGSLRVIREGKRTFVPGSEIARRSRIESAA